jgi:SulP family sulfate permease
MSEPDGRRGPPEPADPTPDPFAARVAALVGAARVQLPGPATVRREVVPALSAAVGGVPDGMAGAVLAGVNPAYGLYAAMIGPLVGGLLAGSQLMRVTSTSASALAAGEAIAPYGPDQRDGALFLLVALIGLVQLAAGLLRLGRFTRFVSHSVMVGFLTGIAVLIVLGQIGNFTGYAAPGPGRFMQAINTVRDLASVDLRSVAVGALALLLMIVLPRTPLRLFAALIALIIPSALLLLLGWDGVAVVRDVGEIPRGLPTPRLPDLGLLSLDLLTLVFAIAAVILVQGAGVAQSVRNPDGTAGDASRDFVAQGGANIAVGLCQGVPVGGSVNQTAFSLLAGARTRWTAIFSGLWMAGLLVVAPGLLEYIAMPALAALLIVAGIAIIKPEELRSIWRTGAQSRIAIATTFLATLFLPVQAAVGIGAALSALFYLNAAATDVALVELYERPDGRLAERAPPRQLPSDAVTVLDVYGSLFYAGARTLESRLPSPRGATRPAVVMRLRGRTAIGATLIDVLARYAADLEAAGGRLYLSGVDEGVFAQLVRTGKVRVDGPVQVYPATDVVGESSRLALADARAWLERARAEPAARPDDAKGREDVQ